MTLQKLFRPLFNLCLLALAGVTLVRAGQDFFSAAWGSGNWLGLFLPKWGLAFFAFAAASLVGWAGLAWGLASPGKLAAVSGPVVNGRERLGLLRWPLILVVAIVPAWMFQYSDLGLVFLSPSMRMTVWTVSALLCGFLLTRGEQPLSWSAALMGIILSGSAILLVFPLQDISSFPFSLGWSEGNRLWDYSILFGRARYLYPSDQPLTPFLDIGRQFTGGFEFLYPGVTIWQARLWQGLMELLPYLALGLAVFRKPKNGSLWLWLLAGLWGFAFLRQGLLHTPLVLVALVVALMWRRPLWLAMPLLAAAAYLAALSRFTWFVAPAMWVSMLVLVDAPLENGRLSRATWMSAFLLSGAALAGGLFFWVEGLMQVTGYSGNVADVVTRQPLLWYRLFPHEALGPGVLGLLLIAVLPLIVTLLFLVRPPRWTINIWQVLVILGSLSAFLAVGVVASAKIGGGGDLHNLDMFLIGLMFLAGLAWDKFGAQWILDTALPGAMKVVVVLLIAVPVYFPLCNMRPLLGVDEFPRLKLLTKAETPRDLNLLPSPADTDLALKDIQRRVANAQAQGEVLFMDQRQLLTFGFIQGVPLIPDYEKKFLMDRAMADAVPVFEPFYADLKAHRFALIVSEPLRFPTKDSTSGFGEENNAWVKWVSLAVLCYYEPDKTYPDVRVQLLAPRLIPIECDLPIP
jgi:hypothetical protein